MVPAVVKPKRAPTLPALVVALLASAALPRVAAAHPEISPQLVNRYLSLIVVGDRLEFFISLLHGALPAAPARKQMDSDGDGRIGEAELAAARLDWKRRAGQLATLTVDGAAVALGEATADVQLGADPAVGPLPVVVEIYGSRPLAPGTRRLRFEPVWDPPSLGETETSLDLSPDWNLVGSRLGQGPEEALSRYKLQGGRRSVTEDRSATFVIRSTSAPPRRPVALLVVVTAAALAAGGLAMRLARRWKARRR
jgi:hypothetical protein